MLDNRLKTLGKNSIAYGLSMGLRFIANAAVFFYIGNFLPVDDFGRITLANTFGRIMIILVVFGFTQLMIREVARNKEITVEYTVNIFGVMLVFSLGTLLLSFILTRVMGYSYFTTIIVFLFLLYFILTAFASLLTASFRGIMKFEYELYSTVLPDLSLVVAIIYLSGIHAGIIPISIAFVLSRLLLFIISLSLFIRLFGVPPVKKFWNPSLAEKLIKESFPFAVAGAMTLIYTQVGILILSYFCDEKQVGIFQGSYRLMFAAVFVLDIIVDVFYPFLAAKYKEGEEVFNSTVIFINSLVFNIILPVMSFIFINSYLLLKTIYYKNPHIMAGWQMLAILSLAYLLYYAPPYGFIFLTMGRQDINQKVSIVVSIVNLALNFILTPRYGTMGTCIAFLISYLVLRIGYTYFYVRLKIPMFSKRYILFHIPLLIVFLFCLIFFRYNIFIEIGLTLLWIFIGIIFALKEETLRKERILIE